MPHRSLAEFLEELGRIGELARIDCEVSPQLEAAEITRRVARQHGPALLFRKLRGYDRPLVTNLLGTEARILAALDADSIGAVPKRIEQLWQAGDGETWLHRLRLSNRGGAAALAAPHKVKSAACQQVVRLDSDVRLDELPIITVAQERKRGVLTLAPVFFADPETHEQYAVCCDVHVAAPGRLAIGGWPVGDDAARIFDRCLDLGRPMPVAIVMGGDPAVLLAAMAPLARADPLALAGILRGKPLDVVGCRSIDLQVPAESDFVIEGHIDPTQIQPVLRASGLSAIGTLEGSQKCSKVDVAAITHRANAVVTAIVRSSEPNEASIISRTLARLFLPATRQFIPGLVDYDLPLVGGGRYVAVVAMEKHQSMQSRRLAAIAAATPGLSDARLTIIVDHDVDVRNFDQVLAAIARHAKPANDYIVQDAAPISDFHVDSRNRHAPRMTIDATRKFRARPVRHTDVRTASMPDEIIEQVSARWAEYGLGPE